ncbi:MAG: hypothetical protein C5B52_10860 [Bacteroidetes bacterium]|nr:MAG: hypothetical protein C5B52_10860 [Bacteroidota bacterium]
MKKHPESKSVNATVTENNLAEILIDRSIDAIIAFDNYYNIIAWNNAAAIIYGKPKENAIGANIFQLIPELQNDPDILNAINQGIKGHKSFVPASKFHSHRLHAENHFIPIPDNAGNIIGVMNIIHDVAHRIKAERQLQHLNEELEERLRQLKLTSEELASFTYLTSNKIKEPIRQVYTGIEHLIKLEASRLTDGGKASFRRMQSTINRMDLLLDDILSLTQISILQKPETTVDLNELFTELIRDIEKKKEQPIKFTIHKLCTITGHRNYLYVLFSKLIDNAVKFNDNLPEIIISCEKVLLEEAVGKMDEFPEYYQVTLRDNGIGFDEADSKKIFSMFEKLHPGKYKGSGMGLTIARKIMDAHHGFIRVESSPGKGSSFKCYFPVTTAG